MAPKRRSLNAGELIKPKLYSNVGCGFDISTGMPIQGNRGEVIFNGGIGPLTVVIGKGNVFKSTILHFLMLRASDRQAADAFPVLMTHDTEINMTHEGLSRLTRHYKRLAALSDDKKGILYGNDPIWKVSDKSTENSEDWFNNAKKSILEKGKDKKNNTIEYEAFNDPYTGKTFIDYINDFMQVDSFSELEGNDTVDLVDSEGIGSSRATTLFMKQGLFKTKLTMELPKLSASNGVKVLLTAQVKEDNINMKSGPMSHLPPPKKLPHMRGDEKIVGVSNKFLFLTNALWYATGSKNLMNQTSKLPEYPKHKDDMHGQELNEVTLKMIRCKTGSSGYNIKVLVSQMDGVIPELTDFHNIKLAKRYGLLGNDRTYQIALKPDVNLSRTTVRSKLAEDATLARAAEITHEMLQLEIFHPEYIRGADLKCTPEELYNDIKEMGYDWDVLLKTRSWWAIKQYSNTEIEPYLHAADLLKMRKGKYHPWWYPTTGIKNPFIDSDKNKFKKYYKK